MMSMEQDVVKHIQVGFDERVAAELKTREKTGRISIQLEAYTGNCIR